ncbi:hypothetical protein OIO90_000474 [Microbotryomycetes sp. JL221]|nr:hypothetical protein OIO90_000474 [Microbotryomycetes sp. JL221]
MLTIHPTSQYDVLATQASNVALQHHPWGIIRTFQSGGAGGQPLTAPASNASSTSLGISLNALELHNLHDTNNMAATTGSVATVPLSVSTSPHSLYPRQPHSFSAAGPAEHLPPMELSAPAPPSQPSTSMFTGPSQTDKGKRVKKLYQDKMTVAIAQHGVKKGTNIANLEHMKSYHQGVGGVSLSGETSSQRRRRTAAPSRRLLAGKIEVTKPSQDATAEQASGLAFSDVDEEPEDEDEDDDDENDDDEYEHSEHEVDEDGVLNFDGEGSSTAIPSGLIRSGSIDTDKSV